MDFQVVCYVLAIGFSMLIFIGIHKLKQNKINIQKWSTSYIHLNVNITEIYRGSRGRYTVYGKYTFDGKEYKSKVPKYQVGLTVGSTIEGVINPVVPNKLLLDPNTQKGVCSILIGVGAFYTIVLLVLAAFAPYIV